MSDLDDAANYNEFVEQYRLGKLTDFGAPGGGAVASVDGQTGAVSLAGTYAPKLTPTATKTAAYTAAAGEHVVMNVAAGATVLTLPAAPADKTPVGYRATGATAAAPMTIARGGTDTIGTSGATTASIPLDGESGVLQYDAANTRWLGISSVKPQAALDARFAAYPAAPNGVDARPRVFAGGAYNLKPTNTFNLRRKVSAAARGQGLCRFMFAVADSKIAGLGSNGATNLNMARNLPGALAALLVARGYPIAGTGRMFLHHGGASNAAGDSRLAFAGTWSAPDTASLFATATASGSTVTATTDKAGTVVELGSLSNSAPFSFTVKGAIVAAGVTVTNGSYNTGTGVVTPSGSNVPVTVVATGLSLAAGDTVVVASTSATSTYVCYLEVRNTTGVEMDNLGIIGSKLLTDWATTSFFNPGKLAQSLAADVVFIEAGTNDARAGVVTRAALLAGLSARVAEHKALGRDVVLIVPSPPTSTDAAGWQTPPLTLWNAFYDAADANDVPLVDLGYWYGSNADAANTAGLMYDGLHENGAGYEFSALNLLAALGL